MITGIVLLGIGAAGVIIAAVMEHRRREPKWLIMMKIMPMLIGVGGVLLGIAISRGVS